MERIRERAAPETEPTLREAVEAAGTAGVYESIFLQPVAAPAILGLYGFAIAQAAIAAGLIGAYTPADELFIAPFAFLLGGVAQFAAAMWAFRARDGLGTGMLGVWGAYWIAYGTLLLLFAAGILVRPVGAFVGLAFVLMPLAGVTYVGAAAATQINWSLFSTLFSLATGAAVGAAGFYSGNTTVLAAAGWIFIVAAAAGWWTASGLMLQAVFHRPILPLGYTKPASRYTRALGEPGVM
jgi:succinate-acetate transporter protein